MMTVLTMVTAFIVAIVILVTFHEFGHFWVARRLGVRVLRFSIGFGKPIYKRVIGKDPVEFVISPIPLGGYVKMLDERDPGVVVEESERHRAYNNVAPWRRIAILLAGPFANFIFAVFAFWVITLAGVPESRVVVGTVQEDSAADLAGLRHGDEILSIGDKDILNWEDALLGLLDELLDDGQIPMTLRDPEGSRRDIRIMAEGRATELTEPGALMTGLGFSTWQPPPIVGQIAPGSPAEAAGFEVLDRIVEVNGQRITDWLALIDYVKDKAGQSLDFTVERDDSRLILAVTPEAVTTEDGTRVARIGVQGLERIPLAELFPEMVVERNYGPLASIGVAVNETVDMSAITVLMLWKMITGEVSRKNISGPINIAEYAGYTASAGTLPFLKFLAIVSISLGILNLLPIPMLDGGQIVYQVAEMVKGSPVSERTQMFGQQVGIGLLVLLIGFALINDISKLLN